jgi:hypothetical protein
MGEQQAGRTKSAPLVKKWSARHLDASFFNTHRMVEQYLLHSYVLGDVT